MSNPQVILITGATAGMGRQTALKLAAAGYRVFASGRSPQALDTLGAEATGQGLSLETLRLDVTDAGSITAARDEIMRRTQNYGVDVLINNAV